jgi:cell division protein FtsB
MMTPGNMDETVSDTQPGQSAEPATNGAPPALEAAPEPPLPPVFDATPWPVAPRPAPRPPSPVRFSRDLGPRLWTAALAAALLFTVGGLAFLYLDDTNSQNAANQLYSQNQALKSQNKQLQAQLLTTQTNLTATLGELATVRGELEHPNLTIWNVPQQINGPSWYLAGGAPDTFTYHLRATSTGPMSISILTLEDFVKAIDCVQNGAGSTHWCMHHSGSPAGTWTDVTTVNYDFHGAEGCADYVVVFTSSTNITVKPNVGVTYNPASVSTGSCA